MVLALKGPIRANFEITEACPLACEHCYAYWSYSATGRRNSRDHSGRTLGDLREVLDVLKTAGIQVITFTGGEPLSRKDLLFPLIREAKSSGIRVLVNTTAALLTAADADKFAELEVDGFLVSLMSNEAATNNAIAHANSYGRTIRGIQLLVQRDMTVTVNMVCSATNFAMVRETAQLAHSLGATMFSATPMLPTHSNKLAAGLHLRPDQIRSVMMDLAWARDNIPIKITTLDPVAHCQFSQSERSELGGLLGERYCCAGVTDCAVAPNGDLRACVMTDEVGGNLLRDGWDAAWASLAKWRSAEMLPEDCRDCDLVGSCGGGCRVAARATSGTLQGRDPYMTLPIVEVRSASPCAVRPAQPDMDLTLEFTSELRQRDEPFGGTLFLRGKAVFLRPRAFACVRNQVEAGEFTVRTWAQDYGVELDDAAGFLGVLLADGFVKVKEREVS